jgi:hypothetical protein
MERRMYQPQYRKTTYIAEIVERLENVEALLVNLMNDAYNRTQPSRRDMEQYERSIGDLQGARTHLRWLDTLEMTEKETAA